MRKHFNLIIYSAVGVLVLAIVLAARYTVLPESVCNWLDDNLFFAFYGTDKKIYSAGYQRLLATYGATQSQILAQMLTAQGRFESGNYTSDAFVKNNNSFGYKTYANSQYQTGQGIAANDGGYYGNYAFVEDSARDVARELCEYPDLFNTVQTADDYAKALQTLGYYGTGSESEYAAGLNTYLNKISV